MANMSDYRQMNGVLIQSLRRRRPADATAVLGAGMFGYGCGGLRRALRIELAHPLGKLCDIGEVQLGPALRLPKTSLGPCSFIDKRIEFGLLQSCVLNQQSLPFISSARFAPLEDDGR